jgi:hypothetical protein
MVAGIYNSLTGEKSMTIITQQPNERDRGYFARHGWLAPGVKLFRTISFTSKSGLILASLLLPIVALLVLLYRAESELLDSTETELQGVAFVVPVTDLIKSVSDLRQSATLKSADLAQKQDSAKAAFAKVETKQAELNKAFGGATDESFAKLGKSLQAVLQQPLLETPDATFAAHTAVLDSALDLLGDTADGSQLALDPELDTYHMMNLAVIVGPQYGEYLARLKGLGYLTLNSKGDKILPPQRLRQLERNLTLIDYIDPVYENSYHKGIASFPEVAQKMDMKGVDGSRDAFPC